MNLQLARKETGVSPPPILAAAQRLYREGCARGRRHALNAVILSWRDDKTDLIRDISFAVDIVLEVILDTTVRSLRAGEKIEVRGFGSFRIRRRLSRIGRNPKTGARVEVAAKDIAFFTPSKELKASLAESK